MRPIDRGENPVGDEFDDHKDAREFLSRRIGKYCCYCERSIDAGIHVEHIKPKSRNEELYGVWNNYILGCPNCNGTKSDQEVDLSEYYFPDRDNTLAAFDYHPDGRVTPAEDLNAEEEQIAESTLSLVGLDQNVSEAHDDNQELLTTERIGARIEKWALAEDTQEDLEQVRNANNHEDLMSTVKDKSAELARAEGHFSVWMEVFEEDQDMRQRFIDTFPGTATECFDPDDTSLVTPRPAENVDHLDHSAKI